VSAEVANFPSPFAAETISQRLGRLTWVTVQFEVKTYYWERGRPRPVEREGRTHFVEVIRCLE
jgi:hypothetical protein